MSQHCGVVTKGGSDEKRAAICSSEEGNLGRGEWLVLHLLVWSVKALESGVSVRVGGRSQGSVALESGVGVGFVG